jgi:hypothetical protein
MKPAPSSPRWGNGFTWAVAGKMLQISPNAQPAWSSLTVDLGWLTGLFLASSGNSFKKEFEPLLDGAHKHRRRQNQHRARRTVAGNRGVALPAP